MSYIFRLYNAGSDTLGDWGKSAPMGTTVIDQIKDPNGESSKREITSIPSPFARIDLLKTAFKKVADGDIDGDTIYHKMVSDCFDIGQIFFEYDKHKKHFEIICWDKTDQLKELLDSPYPAHQQLGDVYKTYLTQDGEEYRFDKMQRMYFLNFKNGPSELNIVGATSPATLFFTTANDLKCVSDVIKFGNDKPFDEDIKPLYQRDLEYLKYLYALRKSIPAFAQLFPEVDKYMSRSVEKMDQEIREAVRNVSGADYQNYSPITVGDGAGHTVSIHVDIDLRQRSQNPANIAGVSEFVIKSNKAMKDSAPLVLPIDTYTHKTRYTLDKWDRNTKVPFYDSRAMQDRTLPDDGTQYPYLTISDFLTDTVVRMPYEIDNVNFFDGNIDRANGNSYLLPLTDTFFKYFDANDLTEMVMTDNKKMFEFENKACGVTVVLRIPIRKGYIEYRRTYFEAGVDACDTKNTNDGALLEKKLGLGILPLVRFPENVQKHYRIAVFDKGRNDITLSCADGMKSVETKQVVRSEKDLSLNICSNESYVVEDNFDRIRVKVGDITEGYIIPNFKKRRGNVQYTFAVDFGTTNTHIEYCTNTNGNPVEFNILNNERQLDKLHKTYADPDIRLGFVQNFIPDTIGKDDVYSFPMRTVFSKHKTMKIDQMPMPLADGNIPFLYEKERTPDYNDIITDLKWDNGNNRLLEMHLETLFILMRNKVVLNGGDLASTKIVWFYPASMTEAKVLQLKKNWKNAYKRYFGDNEEQVISISESTAPYSFYSKKKGARTEVVTIDVGGGTTDVFVVEGREPKMLLSFRFASNSIFGDGYNWDSDNNGFVNIYKSVFEETLASNRLLELQQALNQIETQKKSSDIVAFLFSLTGEKVKNNRALNFLEKLSNNDRMRYVFIVFYASIFYFIAKSMKAKGLKKPLTLAFSGNGSHTLRIVSDEKEMIGRFAQLIFDGVYNDGNKGQIQVIMEDDPKKATCKGGIVDPISQDYDSIENIKTILVGDNLTVFSGERLTYADITPAIEQGVLRSVKEFFNFLFDLHKDNNDFLSNKLAADPAILAKVKELCLDEVTLSQSLSEGLHQKRKEVSEETAKIEETLFFYPLRNVLHDLALKISEM